jgi:hypothetical protein
MPLHHLIYMSKLVDKNETVLHDILCTAVWHNQRNDVTGVMLYAKENILQVLEGDEEVIHMLFARINKDIHHKDVHVMLDAPLSARHFGKWSMGYREMQSVSDTEQFAHYSSVFCTSPQTLSDRARQGPALEVMRSFSAWAMG